MKRRLLALAALVLTAGLTVTVISSSSASTAKSVKNFQHVFVIMMENTGYDALSATRTPRGSTRRSRPTVSPPTPTASPTRASPTTSPRRPARPRASPTTTTPPSTSRTSSTSWSRTEDVEGLHAGLSLCKRPSSPTRAATSFTSGSTTRSSPSPTSVEPGPDGERRRPSQLTTDLANNTVPDYSWISPDQCNDMHGRGGGACGSVRLLERAVADQRRRHVPHDLRRQDHGLEGLDGDSVIFITWDESDFTGSPDNFGFGDTAAAATPPRMAAATC